MTKQYELLLRMRFAGEDDPNAQDYASRLMSKVKKLAGEKP